MGFAMLVFWVISSVPSGCRSASFCRAKASALSRMGLRPTNGHENKGRTGGFACLERAREAERIGCFSTVSIARYSGTNRNENGLPGAERHCLRYFRECRRASARRGIGLTFADRVFRGAVMNKL